MDAGENIHATAIAIGDRGILVLGASGAGKTSLSLSLVNQVRQAGGFASLVADDQVMLSGVGGRLVGRCADTIAGLVELRGLGPRPIEHLASTVVDLVVRLVPAADAQRFPEPESVAMCGCSLPLLRLKERSAASSSRVVLAWLGRAPFRPA
ncbi:MAG: HPr kinase/phosphatase C-terminal domain-containing protein [Rhizobiaceae bacterium]|nr:HPr kinase/phosphatase C-terminal domain-containing protein [Rhizobiaceae bacterium]